MSEKRHKPASRQRPNNPRGPRRPGRGSWLGELRRAIRGIGATADPLMAEQIASMMCTPFRPEFGQRETDRTWTEEEVGVGPEAAMVAELAARPMPDVQALLRAIAALGPPALANAARRAAVRLRAAGLADPTWSLEVGRPEFVDAWAATDELGDQTQLVANFAYPGARAHSIATMLDHNFHGLIREALVSPDAALLRRTWAEISQMDIRAVDAQEVADGWGQGLHMLETYLDPPVSDDVDRLAALIGSRLGLLPTPVPPEWIEVRPAHRRALVAEFRRSPEAAGLGRAAGLAHPFVDFKCDYLDGDPLRWSPVVVELCLTDWLPRKISLDPVETLLIPDVLRRWVRFAARRKGHPDSLVVETLEAIDRFEGDYRTAME
ncbi:MAG: hypothetical protein ACYDB6_12580, partial [Candidatus Limnocylindrales bacterium]